MIEKAAPEVELDGYAAPIKAAKKAARHLNRARREFIQGPLPLAWFAEAAKLPGQALAVSLAIWFRHGIEHRATTVRLYPSALARFSVNRWSGYRALAALERAGLVSVKRARGRSPEVTLLDRAKGSAESESGVKSDADVSPTRDEG